MEPLGRRWARLTPAENRVARLMLEGRDNKEIVAELRIHRSRVQECIRRIRAKAEADTTRAAIRLLAEEAYLLFLLRVLDDLPFAIFVAQDSVVRYANAHFLRTTGHSAEQVVGHTIYEFMAARHDEIRRRHELRMRGADLRVDQRRYHVRAGDGETIPVMTYSGTVQAEGRPAALWIMIPLE